MGPKSEHVFFYIFISQYRPPDTLRINVLRNDGISEFCICLLAYLGGEWTTTNLAEWLHRVPCKVSPPNTGGWERRWTRLANLHLGEDATFKSYPVLRNRVSGSEQKGLPGWISAGF